MKTVYAIVCERVEEGKLRSFISRDYDTYKEAAANCRHKEDRIVPVKTES